MPEDRYRFAIDTMKAKWPTIGEYADHPLGEWFHAHVALKPWRRRYRPRQAASIVLFIAILMLCGPLGILLYIVLRVFFNSKRPHKILCQPATFYDARRAAFLQELWLTGISYQELAAIEVSLAVSRPWRRHIWWAGFAAWGGVGLSILYIIFVNADHIPIDVTILIWTATAFWFEVFFFLANPNKQAMQALKGMVLDSEQRARGKALELWRQTRNSLVGCLGLIGLGMVIGFLADGRSIIIFIGAMLGFGTIYMFFSRRQLQPKAAQELFLETSARGRDYFAEIIYKESERDMPRK